MDDFYCIKLSQVLDLTILLDLIYQIKRDDIKVDSQQQDLIIGGLKMVEVDKIIASAHIQYDSLTILLPDLKKQQALSRMNLHDLSPVHQYVYQDQIEVLDLSDNRLSSFRLRGGRSLQKLDLSGNVLGTDQESFSVIFALPNLTTLVLAGNGISYIRLKKRLGQHLAVLDLSNNRIADIADISSVLCDQNLHLDLQENPLGSNPIRTVGRCYSLKKLTLTLTDHQQRIRTFTFGSTDLNLSWAVCNSIRDISFALADYSLQCLRLRGLGLKSLKNLAGGIEINEIQLQDNLLRLQDIRQLAKLPKLKLLQVNLRADRKQPIDVSSQQRLEILAAVPQIQVLDGAPNRDFDKLVVEGFERKILAAGELNTIRTEFGAKIKLMTDNRNVFSKQKRIITQNMNKSWRRMEQAQNWLIESVEFGCQ